jgi:hypothetical protein
VRSTYCLFAIPLLTVGSLLTVAEVNAAVVGVVAPIVVLFIVVSTTGSAEPVVPIVPNNVLLIFTTILFPADKSKFVPDDNAGIPIPCIFKLQPRLRSPTTPAPPATISAPVVVLVLAVVPVTLSSLNALGAFSTVMVPDTVPDVFA